MDAVAARGQFDKPRPFQIARPALFDQAVVTSMVSDIDGIDLGGISSQPLLSMTANGESDPDIYSECKTRPRLSPMTRTAGR